MKRTRTLYLLFNYESAFSLLFVGIDFAHHLHISIISFHSIVPSFFHLAINVGKIRSSFFSLFSLTSLRKPALSAVIAAWWQPIAKREANDFSICDHTKREKERGRHTSSGWFSIWNRALTVSNVNNVHNLHHFCFAQIDNGYVHNIWTSIESDMHAHSRFQFHFHFVSSKREGKKLS